MARGRFIYSELLFYHFLACAVSWLSLSSPAQAAEPPAALFPVGRTTEICGPDGKPLPLVGVLFALPEGAIAPSAVPTGCDPALPFQIQSPKGEWQDHLPGGDRPLPVLWRDGSRRPAHVIGVVQRGQVATLMAVLDPPAEPTPAAPAKDAAPAAPAKEAAPAGPAKDAAPAAPAKDVDTTEPPDAPSEPGAIALLLGSSVGPAPTFDSAALSGVLRRRVGRQSFAIPGRFIGDGQSYAAIFKRKADSINLALFGEDGALRLYQTVPWRAGKSPPKLKPSSAFTIPDLSGAGKDGLLVAGQGEGDKTSYLLIEFSGKSLRPTFLEVAR